MDLAPLDSLMAYIIKGKHRIGDCSCIPEPGCDLECC